jgi:fructan beta-fructosidase
LKISNSMKKTDYVMTALFLGAISLLFAIFACNPGKTVHNEQHRPQFHFSPAEKWMNDPNGMVYYQGEYHLFYQYYPDSTIWGPMHWGHAVSKDMVNWEHLPIALYPDTLGYIFSGSAVVDVKNTSGFGTAENPPLVAIYTYHNPKLEKAGRNDYQYQGIAFSTDKGRNWTKYASNPVLKNPGIRDFRDPKVSWNTQAKKWIMTLAVLDRVHFYSSPNLKDWTFESEFGLGIGSHGGVWECPDLFPLKVEGTQQTKWVLIVSINPGGPNGGSATQYFVGDFDGKNFVLDTSQTFLTKRREAMVPPGKVLADFEGNSYKDWKPLGEAFGKQPAKGALNNQNPVSNYKGNGLVNSFLNGDGSQGTLTSPEFMIENKYLNFLVGGGKIKGKTCVNLVVNGKIVRTQTGRENEKLDWASWDVSNLKNEKAIIQIVDSATGGWGHISADCFTLANAAASAEAENAIWIDWGKDNYAGVTWADIPENDGRRLCLGWMSNWQYAEKVPTEKWRSAMTIPRELKLVSENGQYILKSIPVKELNALRQNENKVEPCVITDTQALVNNSKSAIINEFELEFLLDRNSQFGTPTEFGIELKNNRNEKLCIGFDVARNQFFVDRDLAGKTNFSDFFSGRHYAEVTFTDSIIRMHCFVDVASVELFAQKYKIALTEIFFPNEDFCKASIYVKNGNIRLKSGKVWNLQPKGK